MTQLLDTSLGISEEIMDENTLLAHRINELFSLKKSPHIQAAFIVRVDTVLAEQGMPCQMQKEDKKKCW